MEDFLRIASEKLQMKATKLFLENGAQIDDIEAIRENDVICVRSTNSDPNLHAAMRGKFLFV